MDDAKWVTREDLVRIGDAVDYRPSMSRSMFLDALFDALPKAEARADCETRLAALRGLDWLYIFDKASGGDGNGTHGQDRFGFNARVKAALAADPEPSDA